MSGAPSNPSTDGWSIDDAKRTYHIDRWGLGYFDIDPEGNVVAKPRPDDSEATIRLTDVIDEARERNLRTPLLIRFQDILRHRVQTINAAFAKAIAEFDYEGSYRGVFPIKVNQLREVVEEIMIAGEVH